MLFFFIKKGVAIIIWGLFDSGEGSYAKAIEEYNKENNTDHKLIPIGLDIKKRRNDFVQLDLAVNTLIHKKALESTLDGLSKPDVILASPPCESWSIGSAMAKGNACWKQEEKGLSRFTVRDYTDFERYQFKPLKSLLNRLNCELCIFNTIDIIKKYKPKFYIIENPAYGRIWDYIENVLGFTLEYKNMAHYGLYGHPTAKPTRFSGNIELGLKTDSKTRSKVAFNHDKDYNRRSAIPLELIKDIIKKIEEQ